MSSDRVIQSLGPAAANDRSPTVQTVTEDDKLTRGFFQRASYEKIHCLVWVPMTLSDLERRDVRGQIFQTISVITLVPFDLKQTNSAWWESVFLWG